MRCEFFSLLLLRLHMVDIPTAICCYIQRSDDKIPFRRRIPLQPNSLAIEKTRPLTKKAQHHHFYSTTNSAPPNGPIQPLAFVVLFDVFRRMIDVQQ